MEVHRLKTMVENYDVKTFNDIYHKTEGLRRKLTSEINPHRFGVQSSEVLSWFDDKFIHVFNKYSPNLGKRIKTKHGMVLFTEEILKGHIINGLQLFKYRVLRGAYTQKYSQTIIQVEDPGALSDLFIDTSSEQPANYYMDLLSTFMKSNLSDNAYYLMEIQLNPPPYILGILNNGTENKKLEKLTDEVILDYFDLPINKKTLRYILGLKEEIKGAIELAKIHFKQ